MLLNSKKKLPSMSTRLTDKRTSPDTYNSDKKDESVDIINEEDDIFDSVEHLWEEHSALKSSLNTLENSLLTIKPENQDIKIMDDLKRIESNLDSKVVTFSKELEKVLNRD